MQLGPGDGYSVVQRERVERKYCQKCSHQKGRCACSSCRLKPVVAVFFFFMVMAKRLPVLSLCAAVGL